MTHASYENLETNESRGGGRVASEQFRHSQSLSDAFLGLEQDTSRYDLLLLVKRVGKHAGFTPRMIQLLDYYMAYTTAIDWEEGGRPIVFQSLSRTALDQGVTERQIQKLEKRLFEVGAITWNDSGNHKRYGHRDKKTGKLTYAYGVELTPLAYIKNELEAKLQEKQLYAKAWQKTKREISSIRRQVRSLLLEWHAKGDERDLYDRVEQRYQEIAVQIRTYMKLEDLQHLLKCHRSLHAELEDIIRIWGSVLDRTSQPPNSSIQPTNKGSCKSEPKFVHSKYSNPIIYYKEKARSTLPQALKQRPEQPEAKAIGSVKLSQVVHSSTDRFRAHLPICNRNLNWSDVLEAAYRRRSELGISQENWAAACSLIGRAATVACLCLTDHAASRPKDSVTRPDSYFSALLQRAQRGELHLANASAFAIHNSEKVD